MPLKPGDTIDRYVIEQLLGVGGMGEVYQARDERLQRKVALKVLRDEPSPGSVGSGPSTGGAARMLREARAAAALDHPNVVAVFDVGHIEAGGELQGTTYLAMELIKGSSLRAYIGDTTVPMAERVRWLVDVARALAAAHAAGLVHRDIKPENVMIREDGAIKVLDFGIARRAHGPVDPSSSTESFLLPTTAHGVVMGTPLYMAPEQLRAESLDGRTDQFAWGVVAYEVLTGKMPWTVDQGSVAVVGQILSVSPRPLDEIADVPPPVAAAVARALSKAPAARFPSMDAVVEALGAKRDVRTSLAPRPSGTSSTTDPLAPTLEQRSAPRTAAAPRDAHVTPPPSSNSTAQRAITPGAPLRPAALKPLVGAGLLLALLASGAAIWRARAGRSGAGPGVSADASAIGGCSSNRSCVAAHGGEAWICRDDHSCVSLASEDCVVHAEPGDVARDSTVWLGVMLPFQTRPSFKQAGQAADLARRDFAATLGQIDKARRIGLLSCDDSEQPQRAAHHLADTVRVPAVLLTTRNANAAVDVVSNVFTPAGVVTLLPHSTAPYLTALPEGASGRLVWRAIFSTEQLVDPITALVEQVIEPSARKRAPGRPIRIAYLHRKDVSNRALSDRLVTALRFNGKPAVDNGDDFLEVAFDDVPESYDHARDTLSRFVPTIVIVNPLSGPPATLRAIVEGLEAGWRASTPPPTYLFCGTLAAEVLDFIGSNAGRRRRFFGTETSSNTVENAQFVSHYNETFTDQITRVSAPNNIYDGFYALAYSIHGLGDAPVTGPSIARGFRRLAGPGDTFTVGTHAIFDAYRALHSGATIDLEGTAGHLDLNPETGESTFDIAILCAAPSEAGAAPHTMESGLVYDGRQRRFRGTLSCP
jgi:serine/threonine-protein kinase